MTKINRKVEYAFIALKHMGAKPAGELTTAKEISEVYGCSFDVMSRVLQNMSAARILRSEQGASGGYLILASLDGISLFDLIRTLMGPVAIAKCLHSPSASCSLRDNCNIYSPIHSLNRRLEDFYKGLYLSQLLQSNSESPFTISQEPESDVV